MHRPGIAALFALLLSACAPAPSAPSDPADFVFMGSWDCGVTVMTFMPDSYLPSNDADPIPISRFNRLSASTTEITLSDGSVIAVQNATERTMTWFSHTSGDSFDCTRVAG